MILGRFPLGAVPLGFGAPFPWPYPPSPLPPYLPWGPNQTFVAMGGDQSFPGPVPFRRFRQTPGFQASGGMRGGGQRFVSTGGFQNFMGVPVTPIPPPPPPVVDYLLDDAGHILLDDAGNPILAD